MSIRFDRLSQIAEDVRRASAHSFNMDYWQEELVGAECGTVRCAIGWHVHFHPDCGLRLAAPCPGYPLQPRLSEAPQLGQFDAVACYCGITNAQARFLFLPENYGPENYVISREEVVETIEQFIRDHREPQFISLKADAPAPVAALGESQ